MVTPRPSGDRNNVIKAGCLALVVTAMQEEHVSVMLVPAGSRRNAALLIEAACELQGSVFLTKMDPQGFGKTMQKVANVAAGFPVFEKMYFSCMEDAAFADALTGLDRRHIVLAGMKAHPCVVQTAASLPKAGYEVFVVSDAMASQSAASEQACLDRLCAAGVGIVTTEMVVFEWLGKAGTPALKKMLPKAK